MKASLASGALFSVFQNRRNDAKGKAAARLKPAQTGGCE
jgi:hypothetical protein